VTDAEELLDRRGRDVSLRVVDPFDRQVHRHDAELLFNAGVFGGLVKVMCGSKSVYMTESDALRLFGQE